MSGSTDLSLADVTSDTIAALWTKIYSSLRDDEVGRSMLVCKAFKDLLPPLIQSIHYSGPVLNQKSFERFAKTFNHVQSLEIHQEYDDNLAKLDWSRVSLPRLRDLTLACCPVKSIEFDQTNTPLLEHLSIENQGPEAAACFKLNLPNLESIDFEYVNVSCPI